MHMHTHTQPGQTAIILQMGVHTIAVYSVFSEKAQLPAHKRHMHVLKGHMHVLKGHMTLARVRGVEFYVQETHSLGDTYSLLHLC